jgi:EpsD family peptidyl-prolyl cis-trans isomerase
MNRFAIATALALATVLSLSACNDKAKAPTGQVVATVDGEEITSRELQNELTGATFADDQARKDAEQAALRVIINRHLLAKAARERDLDKNPDFALQKKRAEDFLLVQQLQNSIVKSVPAATPEEAQRFITDHPDTFAERKIFLLDQVRVTQPVPPAVTEQLRPLKSLDEVIALLNANNIPFQRAPNRLDAVGSDPRMIETIVKLNGRDLFAVPTGQMLMINEVKGVQVQPFVGEAATNYAIQQLSRQHSQEAVTRDFRAIVDKGAGKIKYSDRYAPAAGAPSVAGAPLAVQGNAPAAQ